MKEFLNELYSYEYFGVYLIISIVVLIILFVIILFLGKKDKKEREKTATLKLQQINNEAFKEESVMEPLEIPSIPQESLENDTIIVPNISDVSDTLDDVVDEIPAPVLPIQNEMEEVEQEENTLDEITDKIEEPNIDLADTLVMEQVELNEQTAVYEEVVTPVEEVTPLLSKVEEKPLVFSDYKDEANIPSLIDKVEEVQEPEEVEVPTFNFDEIVKGVEETKKEQTYTRGPEIFSSVYVPKKEEVELPKVEINESVEPKVQPLNDLGIELPTLKKEVVEEPKIEEPTPVIEAPVEEKTEEKIEMPVLNDYNLDSLSGEIYNIYK